jgi:hypothetical protein
VSGAGPAPCRLLRSRGAYGRSADGAPWQDGDSPLEAYWCLATQEPVGPDDALVHAKVCRDGRACFAGAAVTLAGGAATGGGQGRGEGRGGSGREGQGA